MISLSHKTFLGFAIPLLFLFLGLYLWQINAAMSTRALYDASIQGLQELQLRNQQLEIALSKTDTPGILEEQLKNSFEPVAQVVYLRILGGAVARSYGEVSPP